NDSISGSVITFSWPARVEASDCRTRASSFWFGIWRGLVHRFIAQIALLAARLLYPGLAEFECRRHAVLWRKEGANTFREQFVSLGGEVKPVLDEQLRACLSVRT